MNPLEQHYKNVKEFKLGLAVVILGILFFLLNKPTAEASEINGVVESCSDYRFFRETGKELTIKIDNGNIEVMKFYKCNVGQAVSITIQKRLITRQHVYTIKYI